MRCLISLALDLERRESQILEGGLIEEDWSRWESGRKSHSKIQIHQASKVCDCPVENSEPCSITLMICWPRSFRTASASAMKFAEVEVLPHFSAGVQMKLMCPGRSFDVRHHICITNWPGLDRNLVESQLNLAPSRNQVSHQQFSEDNETVIMRALGAEVPEKWLHRVISCA